MSLLTTIKSWFNNSAATPVEAEEVAEAINYSDFVTSELKAMAKERGLKGYSKLNKRELIELMQQTHQ